MLLIIEQLWPPCRLIVLYCSSMSSSHIILLIIEQLRLPCQLVQWHPCHSHYTVGSCCCDSSMRPYKVFLAASLPTLIAASCRLYLRHYCRLGSSSHMTTCGITAELSDFYTAHWWAVATSMSTDIFIVASMPLPHSCLEALLVRPSPSSGPSLMTNYTTLLANILKLLKLAGSYY
jgi:hypothetical protein